MFQRRCHFQFISLFYIIIILPQATLSPVRCPAGQIGHRWDIFQTRCCKPWPYNCPPGYPYTICDKPGGWDHCQKCRTGFIQPNPSNSSSPKLMCFRKKPGSCRSEDQIPLSAPAQGHPTLCVCDRSQDYYEVPQSCDLAETSCGIGKERHLNGSCSSCVNGTFKNWKDSGLCIPITNCKMNRQEIVVASTPEKDNVCGGGTTTTRPPTTTAQHQTSSPKEPQPVTKPTQDHSTGLKWLHILWLLPVIALVVGSCMCIKKRGIPCAFCRLCHLKCTDICARCFSGRRDERSNNIPLTSLTSSGPRGFNEEHIYEVPLVRQQHPVQALPTPPISQVFPDMTDDRFEGRSFTEGQRSEDNQAVHNLENEPAQSQSSAEVEGTSENGTGDVNYAQMNFRPNQQNRRIATVKPMPCLITPGPADTNLVLLDGDEPGYSRMGEVEEYHLPDHLRLHPGPSSGIGDGQDEADQDLPHIHNLPPMEISPQDMLVAVSIPAPSADT